jgi:asparaginyl-tRNA synthetase
MTDVRSQLDDTISPPRSWDDPQQHWQAVADSPWYQMITRLFGALLEATSSFYAGVGITPALMPLTVSTVSSPMGLGSDSLPVRIDLLGDRVYLADSMQFQLEFLLRHGLQGAYYVMPSFRGEEADEAHLNQFFHSEAEVLGDLGDGMELVEQYMRALTNRMLMDSVSEQIARCVGGLGHLESFLAHGPLPQITFDEAADLLGSGAFELRSGNVPVITRPGEATLIERFGGAVWLTHPPHLSVPFYQRRDAHGRAECADLLLGIGEVVGCGARHIDGEAVRAALRSHGIDPREYAWYIDMKDTHPLATCGFGLGVERYLLWLLAHHDIRDLHVMPRIKGLKTCI